MRGRTVSPCNNDCGVNYVKVLLSPQFRRCFTGPAGNWRRTPVGRAVEEQYRPWTEPEPSSWQVVRRVVVIRDLL
jgi:hypothetical protein